jgi:hypothetical protein
MGVYVQTKYIAMMSVHHRAPLFLVRPLTQPSLAAYAGDTG